VSEAKAAEAGKLLALLRDLADDADGPTVLEVLRWTNKDGSLEDGQRDDDATALIRSLARAALDGIDLADVGRASLAALDRKRRP
jgi:hypothetical protein